LRGFGTTQQNKKDIFVFGPKRRLREKSFPPDPDFVDVEGPNGPSAPKAHRKRSPPPFPEESGAGRGRWDFQN
jgi:hypothetical protein